MARNVINPEVAGKILAHFIIRSICHSLGNGSACGGNRLWCSWR